MDGSKFTGSTAPKSAIVINPDASHTELLAEAEERIFAVAGYLSIIATSTALDGDAETNGMPGAAFGMQRLAEQALAIIEELQRRPLRELQP